MHTKTRVLPVRVENVPQELKARPQWVVWKAVGEKPDKVPYSARDGPKASSTDLMTWSTFEEALGAYGGGGYAGVSFVLSSADPFTGIDFHMSPKGGVAQIRPLAQKLRGLHNL